MASTPLSFKIFGAKRYSRSERVGRVKERDSSSCSSIQRPAVLGAETLLFFNMTLDAGAADLPELLREHLAKHPSFSVNVFVKFQ